MPIPVGSRTTALSITHVVLSLDVGGLERIVLYLAKAGQAAGQNVSVICLQRAGVLGAEAESAGLRLISLGKRPGLTPGLIPNIRAALRELRPDVVHTHQIGALLYTGPAAHREHVPVILHTEHINHLTKSWNWSERMRIRLLWWCAGRYAGRFCCVSKDIADSAVGLVRKGKLRVVDNGIPIDVFNADDSRHGTREALGIPANAPVIGIVARLNEVKCQDILIRAFAHVRGKIPNAHLLLVGDGPTRAALIKLTEDLQLTTCVHFAGYQSEPHRFLQAMDLFVLPSRLEGMPLAILEAWAARLPVIATRVGGVPNVVADGKNGLLIEPEDQADLESKILRVLADKALAQRLGNAGRARVEADFDTRRMAGEYQRLYLEILQAS